MSYALSSGVTGLQAHQEMLDVAGNNLANVNTTAFKASRVGFAELLSQTLEQAAQPTSAMGGTNPQQMGSGVGVASITPNMGQGSIVNTGSPLDVALEGEGYFVVSDGNRELYTRSGAFGVDANGDLVDPASGYRVQRIGLTGESDGFQIPGDSNIRIPYGVALPARMTSEITLTGNLSSDAAGVARTQVLTAHTTYTVDGSEAVGTATIDELDQFSGGSGVDGQLGAGQTGTLTISGFNRDGTQLNNGLAFTVTDVTTINDLVDHLNNNVLTDATASLVNGQIRVTDNASGCSRTDLRLSYAGAGAFTTPAYFDVTTAGGYESKNVNIAVYDSHGGKHVLSAALVRTDTVNTWDLILTSMTGNVHLIDPAQRRVNGLTFDPQSGAFVGIPETESGRFTVTFAHDLEHPQVLSLDFGTVGSFDGLTQFAGNSTAVAREQDGYEAGNLAAVSVTGDGTMIGAFTNGVKKDLATLQVALFNNPAALQGAGGGYYAASANSGGAVATRAMSTGAGVIHGGALEKSNVDVATEFVSMIEAQNGYQANARTIRVANDILRELTNLIR
ncbi:MAG: flagellar hook-basal body complex protein [Planctomycetes bacterium]|jgi:flagellar hook protein FlgE|nr:flagellar hook-basal body complex protein [Planctomycetota bacterium]